MEENAIAVVIARKQLDDVESQIRRLQAEKNRLREHLHFLEHAAPSVVEIAGDHAIGVEVHVLQAGLPSYLAVRVSCPSTLLVEDINELLRKSSFGPFQLYAVRQHDADTLAMHALLGFTPLADCLRSAVPLPADTLSTLAFTKQPFAGGPAPPSSDTLQLFCLGLGQRHDASSNQLAVLGSFVLPADTEPAIFWVSPTSKDISLGGYSALLLPCAPGAVPEQSTPAGFKDDATERVWIQIVVSPTFLQHNRDAGFIIRVTFNGLVAESGLICPSQWSQ